MAVSKNDLLNQHASAYVLEVMAEQLRQSGFRSKSDNLLRWYRLVGDNVVHTVYFCTSWPHFPIIMDIRGGFHPLFIAPDFSKNVYMPSGRRSRDAVSLCRPIMKDHNLALYREDIAVTCPDDGDRGADLLAKIIKKLDWARTPGDCYDLHKKDYMDIAADLGLPAEAAFRNISVDFINEAIYHNDTEMYPYAVRFLQHQLECQQRARQVRKLTKVETQQAQEYQQLLDVLLNEDQARYVEYLEQTAKKNLAKLKRIVT